MARYIDFHSHVLPRMDDGSDSLETTYQLLTLLSDQGITTVCATSHYYRRRESIDHYLNRRAAAYRALAPQWRSSFPKLLPGAEVAFFTGIAEEAHLDRLCYGATKTLLLEMPFTDWSASVEDEVMHLALDRDFHIVLAHPERYTDSGENLRTLGRFSQAGIGFQVNADTLLHWSTRKTGLSLLEMTAHPVLGSDSHNLTSRAPHIKQARDILAKKLGEAFLRRLDRSMEDLLDPRLTEVTSI